MTSARTASRWVLWFIALVAITAVLRQWRGDIEQSHVVLTFLLVVLGGSAVGGRRLGYTLAVVGFLLIDYYFQPPYDLLSVDKTLDWVVLLAFLLTAFVATELLSRARAQADMAERHANEILLLGTERVRLAEEAQAARELRETNRAKDEVLATVSHDLRTPITTIKLLAQQGASRGELCAAPIEEQTDRLAQLVTNVLDLSRIRAGAVAFDIQLNTVEDLLGAAMRRAEGIRGSRRIVHRLNLESPVLIGRFDFVQSLRIVGNLIDNAIRLSPPNGDVELAATIEGDDIVIRVADRGPGIAASEVGRIFEAFYRPKSEAPDAGRAGLGLSIARQLAQLQGGSLAFEARAGGGAIFIVHLPAAQLEPSALEDEPLDTPV